MRGVNRRSRNGDGRLSKCSPEAHSTTATDATPRWGEDRTYAGVEFGLEALDRFDLLQCEVVDSVVLEPDVVFVPLAQPGGRRGDVRRRHLNPVALSHKATTRGKERTAEPQG